MARTAALSTQIKPQPTLTLGLTEPGSSRVFWTMRKMS